MESAFFRGSTQSHKEGRFRYERCLHCGVLRADFEIDPGYHDYPTRSWIPRSELKRLIRFMSQANIRRHHHVLDYGCGQGALIHQLRSLGFKNISGYDPYHPDFSEVKMIGTFDAILLIHVWEHLQDPAEIFPDLERFLKPGGKILLITPSSSRFPALDSDCPFQSYTVHAPFHREIPEDQGLRKLFAAHRYRELTFLPHDVQKSGLIRNNAVYALFMAGLGGTKDAALEAGVLEKLGAFFRNPFAMLDRMLFRTRDSLVSSFIFERPMGLKEIDGQS